MCEEYESLHERTVRPVVMGQSIVLSAIKTEVSLENDDPVYKNFLFQQYAERIENLSQQDKLSKFRMDAGFLSVVENGQYFMTKDAGDLTQFNTVACREYTLPEKEAASQPKGWIRGNTKIGPALEVTTSYLHGKHGSRGKTNDFKSKFACILEASESTRLRMEESLMAQIMVQYGRPSRSS